MTDAQPIDSEPGDGAADMLSMYQRLGAMDPPVLRSLAVELQRLSDESSAAAAVQATLPEQSKARRDAQRAAAARAALASVQPED